MGIYVKYCYSLLNILHKRAVERLTTAGRYRLYECYILNHTFINGVDYVYINCGEAAATIIHNLLFIKNNSPAVKRGFGYIKVYRLISIFIIHQSVLNPP